MIANIFVKMHNFEVVCHDSNILDEVKNNEELNLSSQKNLLGHKPMTFSRLQPEKMMTNYGFSKYFLYNQSLLLVYY